MAPILTAEGGIYLHSWSEFSDVVCDFFYPNGNEVMAGPQLQGIDVLLASYGEDIYGGRAFVLFRKDGKLFEVNGSHCSWYGLEGQWEPDETSVDVLRHRIDKGRLGSDDWSGNDFKDELRAVLDSIDGGGEAAHVASPGAVPDSSIYPTEAPVRLVVQGGRKPILLPSEPGVPDEY